MVLLHGQLSVIQCSSTSSSIANEFCAHGPYGFVQSHCVENLILLNSMKKRLNIEIDPVADAEFVAGLGPNANGFIQSYVAMDNSAGYSTNTAPSGSTTNYW